jgi:hypothetical protein
MYKCGKNYKLVYKYGKSSKSCIDEEHHHYVYKCVLISKSPLYSIIFYHLININNIQYIDEICP